MFTGVYTALITPFDKNYEVDYVSLTKLLYEQKHSDVSGVVLLGTTAEECTLNSDECKKIIELAKQILTTKQIIIGVSGNCTKTVIEKMASYEKFNADGYLVGTPYYNKPTQHGLFLHFQEIAKHTTKPIILYNIPSRCGIKLDFDLLEKLSKIKNIVAIKEASGDTTYFSSLIAKFKDRYNILCGNDNMFLPMLSCGATGCVSVISNLFPNILVGIYEKSHHNMADAQNLHNKYLNLCNAMFVETNPAPIKYALSKKHLCENILRRPLISIEKESQKTINAILKDINL